jgi:hypothetical protein
MSFIPESPVASVVITVVSAFAGMLVGPAFARVGEIRDVGQPTALSTIFADAKAESGVIAQRTGRPRTSGKPMSDADRIALGVVVVVGLTIAYMSFRVPVLLGISALAFVVAILATISLVRMSRVGVIAGGRSFGAVVVGLFSSSALGILSVALLWSPLLGGDVLQRAVEQFAGKSGYGGLDGFVYVTLQMTGAVAYIFVAAACVAFSIGVITAINLRTGAWGRPLWRFVYRYASIVRSGYILAFVIFATLLSLACSSGLLFHAAQEIQKAS